MHRGAMGAHRKDADPGSGLLCGGVGGGMGQEEQNEAHGERKTHFVNMAGSLL